MKAADGKDYPAVYKSGTVHDVNNVQVAEIHSTPDMKVYAIPAPKDMNGVDVQKYAVSIVSKIHDQQTHGLDGQEVPVQFPMVDMNSKADLTGLIGLVSKDQSYVIAQAKMQTMLQMDENGFKAKQAQSMEVLTKGLSPPPFQIKDKFIFAVATADGNLAFATQVGQENWKRPPKTN